MTAAMERALRTACVEMGDAMLTSLAEHYKMDFEELRRVSGVSDLVVTKAVKKATKKERKSVPKKDKKPVPSMPLPFIGKIDEEVCYGIRLNHGLHTQCSNFRVEGMDYCKTCVKHAEKNASGKPTYGDIRDRLECGLLEYRDPKGKQTLPYINVVEKLGLDMDAVKAEAAKFGIEIPEEHLVKRETKRGRPKKDETSVSDTSSEASEPKKRGRPKKEKKVESVVGDDLLMALKNAQSDAKKVADIATSDDSKSVSSSTSKKSGGRKRLSEEEKAAAKAKKEAEKQRKAEEKAAAKAKKEAEKEAEKQRKAEEKAAAKAKKEAEKEAEKEDVEEDVEEEESIKVKKFELNGVTYLRTADNVLYDIDTQEPVGIYDPETGEIEEVDAVSDDESEDDE